MDELKLLLEALKTAKKVEAAGFSTPDEVKTYLAEKEALMDSVAKAMDAINETQSAEIGALKAQVEGLKASITTNQEPKILSQETILADIGKMVTAICRRDTVTIGENKYATPNLKSGVDMDWTRERAVSFDKNGGRFVNRDPTGTPVGQGTDGQYVINTIYERELLRYANKQSAMMGQVRTVPMIGNTLSWPTLDKVSGNLTWHNNPQGDNHPYREVGRPSFGARVELTCQTLAGWIPWYDMFQDDIQVNVQIGQLFMEMFAEIYGQEFDYQVLFASSDPFTGLFKAAGTLEYTISGSTPMATVLDDLVNAPLRVRFEDRSKGLWIVSEDFVTWLAANRNALGDYVWQSPIEGQRPGQIAGRPYIEVHNQMKSIHEVGAGEAFAWYGDPKQVMWHGDRMGIEIRSYRETTENMLYGEEFIRFRKRDGFKAVQTDKAVLLKTAARG